ncbi:MAG: hypothetical protein EP326_06050 [Deltaproteobacteria bacterium]|nr:MAG: hypothetical protein EP326_06050 [Deltaproteobacteria bacterium]
MRVVVALVVAVVSLSAFSNETDVREINHQLENATAELQNLNRNEVRCPENQTEGPQALPLNPRHHRERQPENIGFFYELQYGITGQNGEQSFISTPIGTVNLSSAVKNYANRNGMTREQVLALPDDQFRNILSNSSSSLTGQALEDAVDNAMIIRDLSYLENDQAMYAALKTRMQGASFGKKMGLLATFLDTFGNNYDNNRTDSDHPNSEGSVTLTQMMQAHNSNFRTGSNIDAGVCRDMHQAAVRLAHAMGMEEAFGVGFRTQGGGHRTLVVTDPNNRGNTYQLNYGRILTQDGVAGPSALSQNHTLPDTGIRFRVYNANDKPAIILPSDRGTILNRMTGGQDTDLDLLHSANLNVVQGGIATPYGNFRAYNAKANMGNGEEITGISYNVHIDYNKTFYGEYGITGFEAKRDTEKGVLKSMGVYIRTTQGFNHQTRVSDNVVLETHGAVHLRTMYSNDSIGGNNGESNMDYNVNAQYGVRAHYSTGNIRHTTGVTFDSALDQADALDGAQGVTVITPTTLITHEMEIPVAEQTRINTLLGVGFRDLGTARYATYDAEIGITNERTGTHFYVGSEGAINNNTPIWLPGSERVGQIGFRQNLVGEHLQLNVTGSQSFENRNNNMLMVGITGRF